MAVQARRNSTGPGASSVLGNLSGLPSLVEPYTEFRWIMTESEMRFEIELCSQYRDRYCATKRNPARLIPIVLLGCLVFALQLKPGLAQVLHLYGYRFSLLTYTLLGSVAWYLVPLLRAQWCWTRSLRRLAHTERDEALPALLSPSLGRSFDSPWRGYYHSVRPHLTRLLLRVTAESRGLGAKHQAVLTTLIGTCLDVPGPGSYDFVSAACSALTKIGGKPSFERCERLARRKVSGDARLRLRSLVSESLAAWRKRIDAESAGAGLLRADDAPSESMLRPSLGPASAEKESSELLRQSAKDAEAPGDTMKEADSARCP